MKQPPFQRSTFSLTHAIMLHMPKTNEHTCTYKWDQSKRNQYIKGRTTQTECYCKFSSTTEYLEMKSIAQRNKIIKLEFSFKIAISPFTVRLLYLLSSKHWYFILNPYCCKWTDIHKGKKCLYCKTGFYSLLLKNAGSRDSRSAYFLLM